MHERLFGFIDISTAVTLSSNDTQQMGMARDGFTYGETTLPSVWKILQRVDLASYRCHCTIPPPRSVNQAWWLRRDPHERCSRCSMRPAGAHVVDLGSGVGNVVVATALLQATGALGDDNPLSSVTGVELLPTLHAVAASAVNGLRSWAKATHRTLPHIAVHCADLMSHDLSTADIVYMASTVFDDALLQRFARSAAMSLQPGSRVVTLARPLSHAAFRVESVVACTNSWGAEDAYVQVIVPDAVGGTHTDAQL